MSISLSPPFTAQPHRTSRREFLRRSLALGAAIAVPLACNDALTTPAAAASLDLGTEDGILNALYTLDQLSGDLYTRIIRRPFIGMTAAELTLFTDMIAHDTAAIQLYFDRLRSSRVYDLLEFEFSAVNLDTRTSVFDAARAVAEGSASAYLSAAAAVRGDGDRRTVAKLASVKSRHAAVIRVLADPASGTVFADSVVGVEGLSSATTVGDVLDTMRPFFRTTLTVSR